MFKRLILVSLLLVQGVCFAYEKQNDEYSCGAVSSLNLINETCNTCKNKNFNTFSKLLRTDKNGTTTFNLCHGLDKYLSEQNLSHKIYYYGIKKVKKYRLGQVIDLDLLRTFTSDGYQAIINIGIYKNINGDYVRQYGHYVNLVDIEDTKLKVFDPYDKENTFTYWELKPDKINLKNCNDNEKYEKTNEYLIVKSNINYLKQNERAAINGVIFIQIESK